MKNRAYTIPAEITSFSKLSMLSLTRHSVRVFQRLFARSYTFEAVAQDHHVLANNLQKIAEMDRKFVSYEV